MPDRVFLTHIYPTGISRSYNPAPWTAIRSMRARNTPLWTRVLAAQL
jgi:hypothetical protein